MLKFLLNKALVSVCKIKLKDQVSPLNYYDWIRFSFSVSGQNLSHLKENARCPTSPYFVSLITYLIGETGFSFVQWICTKQNDKQQTFKVPNVNFHFSVSLYQSQIYIFCSFLFFAKMMFTFYKRPIVHVILLIRLGLFWWKKKVWFSIWSCSPRKQTQTQLTILTQRPRVLLSAKCCHTASIREQAAIQHCNKKCIWHFLSYLQFSWMLHCSEWWLQIPGDNPAHSPFKTGILMAPIRDGHLSSDIVVFILAFCLFCGNCVCTQAYGINRWQSFLSEASPRHLSHPLCRAMWDKFIRNICTGLQYRQRCILCIFCTLGSTNRSKRWKDTFCKRPSPHSGLLSSLN